MATLYISDLDGTLLNHQSKISSRSANIINHLIDNGIFFSVATARNVGTAFDKIEPLHLNIPFSLMNGVFIYNRESIRPVDIKVFPTEQASYILKETAKIGASPFLYTYNKEDSMLCLSFHDLDYPARQLFYRLRKDCKYKKFVLNPNYRISSGSIPVYINFLDEYDKLQQVHEIIQKLPGVQSVFYYDPVLKAWYLEVFSDQAGKAVGAQYIADYIGADKIVSFGDNHNDLPMFQISDRCYATENAELEIQQHATGVILSCDRDGVATFLSREFHYLF